MTGIAFRVLVVDDRQWAQFTAEDIEAEADTITVTVAGSATGCLEIFRDREDIDCILADYQMPGTRSCIGTLTTRTSSSSVGCSYRSLT